LGSKEAALFEKSAQKLLLLWATGRFTRTVQIKKVFLLLRVPMTERSEV
jgi:hypothetical protein